MPTLKESLANLAPDLRARIMARGFDPAQLEAWAASAGADRDGRNRLKGTVEPPRAGDVLDLPADGSPEKNRQTEIGLEVLRRGEVALCVLAGGMATRMGGVVKSLVEAIPGKTFLDIRLAENDHLAKIAGKPVPLWLMTSEATDGPIRAALGARCDGEHIATFEQCVSLRLTPERGLFLDEHGEPSVYATGHGDLPDALKKSGLLDKFLARGGKYVWLTNIDNLGATVDPSILGWHVEHGGALTVELVDKVGSDRGGGPVRWNGKPIITEEFRVPLGFDLGQVPVFNTNTFLARADALAKLDMTWTYVEVEKKIAGKVALQFERLLGEITAALEPKLLRVPRDGTAARFLPVKDMAELERRRGEIQAIGRARGFLP